MTRRKVELMLHREEFLTAIGGHIGKEECAVIGYLTTWAQHSSRYQSLTLFGDNDGNIHATYHDENGQTTYTIFAQRSVDGTYSTHS